MQPAMQAVTAQVHHPQPLQRIPEGSSIASQCSPWGLGHCPVCSRICTTCFTAVLRLTLASPGASLPAPPPPPVTGGAHDMHDYVHCSAAAMCHAQTAPTHAPIMYVGSTPDHGCQWEHGIPIASSCSLAPPAVEITTDHLVPPCSLACRSVRHTSGQHHSTSP
jgi:hypothetical protein